MPDLYDWFTGRKALANTHTQIHIQIVFAVSGRINLIHSSYQEELNRYITGIVQNKRQKLLAINGVSDHIHILIGMKPDMALSDLVHDVKIQSTRFMNEKGWFGGGYAWQRGFAAFSYSRSHLGLVIQYVLNQPAHHLKTTFRQEYTALLERFEVEYDERFLFDFIPDPTLE